MEQNIILKDWKEEEDKVRLIYSDDSTLFVSKKDFNRAFGCIIALTKEEAERDFAIKEQGGK